MPFTRTKPEVSETASNLPMTPSVSIVVPVYNGAEYLDHALHSAESQTKNPSEIVVVDDASTDETPSIIRQHAPRLTKQARLAARVPAASAWNAAIRESSSDFFVVLAHDDLLEPNFVEEVTAVLNSHPDLDLLICANHTIDTGGNIIQRYQSSNATPAPRVISAAEYLDCFTRFGQWFLPTSVVTRRSLFERLNGFDPNMKVAYDWDFYLRAGAASGARIVSLDKPLSRYRIHPKQSIHLHTTADNGDNDRIFDKLPTLCAALSEPQRQWLLNNIGASLRRLVTARIPNRDIPPQALVESRAKIQSKLVSWRQSANPCAKYVSLTAPSFKQRLMWNIARSATTIKLSRLVLR